MLLWKIFHNLLYSHKYWGHHTNINDTSLKIYFFNNFCACTRVYMCGQMTTVVSKRRVALTARIIGSCKASGMEINLGPQKSCKLFQLLNHISSLYPLKLLIKTTMNQGKRHSSFTIF